MVVPPEDLAAVAIEDASAGARRRQRRHGWRNVYGGRSAASWAYAHIWGVRRSGARPVADRYFEAGFTVLLQDILLGAELPGTLELITSRPSAP